MDDFTFQSCNVEETERLGRALGSVAQPQLVVALTGQLGAGKTAFTRGVAQGVQTPDLRAVTSPTFVLIQEYAGRVPVYHFDTYRLDDEAGFADLGAHEYFEDDGVCIVEWADKVTSLLPEDRLELRFEIGSGNSRRIHCKRLGKRWARLFTDWHETLNAT